VTDSTRSAPPKKRSRAKLTTVLIAALLLGLLFWPVWWTYTRDNRETVAVPGAGRAAVIWLYDKIADHVLAHVDLPLDFELPVTPTSYPSGPTTAAVIGGRGHGLDCSLPPGAGYAFRPHPGAAPVALRFRQACAFHDFCYRHGLATYGYQQNDCDEMLQEHSFRICRYVFGDEKTIDECRLEAKKITLAVRLFGSDAFQGWGNSTYYEFDPFPVRASRFSAARLLTREPDGPRGKGLDLVRFDVNRVGLSSRCINCAPSHEPSVIPLPRAGVFAAPQLVATADGNAKLAFVTREAPDHTGVLLASGLWDSGQQTVTLNAKSNGLPGADGDSDLNGSTVYAVDAANDPQRDAVVFATPTIQCKSSNPGKFSVYTKRLGVTDPEPCPRVDIDGVESLAARYQFFQHPIAIDPVRRRGILLKRGNEDGTPYDKFAAALLIDFPRSGPTYHGTLLRGLALTKTHEPAFPLPHAGKETALVSLVATGNTFAIDETLLSADRAVPARGMFQIAGQAASLPRTWIDRAPILLRADNAKLVLTRVTPNEPVSDKPATDDANLDLLLLRREENAGGVRWTSGGAMRCEVSYRIPEVNPERACLRRHERGTPLPTMLHRLRGSQTLAGEVGGATDVVVIDPCLPDNPIVLQWTGDTAISVPASTSPVGKKLVREIKACRPLDRAGMLAD
jgi:hypothetical protein